MFKDLPGLRLFKWLSGASLAIILVLWSYLFHFPDYSTLFIYVEEEMAFLGGLVFLAFLGVYLAFLPLESFLERLDRFNYFLQRIPRLGSRMQQCSTQDELFELIAHQVKRDLPYKQYAIYCYSREEQNCELLDGDAMLPENITDSELLDTISRRQTMFWNRNNIQSWQKELIEIDPLITIPISGLRGPAHLLVLTPAEYPAQDTLHRIIGNRYGEEISETLRQLALIRREEVIQEELNKKIERATQQINSQREFLSSVLNSLEEGLIVVNNNNVITFANAEALNILNCNEILENKDFTSIKDSLPAEVFETRKQYSPRVVKFQKKYIEFEWHPVRGSENQLLLLRNRTRREKMQRQLQLNETLSLIGEMAGSVAHELRNPLAGMELYIGLLKRHNKNEELEKPISKISAALRAIQRATDSLLNFTRSGQALFQRLDINKLLSDVLKHCGPMLEEKGITVNNYLPDLPEIKADTEQMRSVFINLIQNAAEAQQNGGKIDIEGHQENNSIFLLIRDYGPGISEKKQKDIFQRFFTTKTSGSGIGLAICRRMIEVHSGEIYVDSKPGEGSIFTVELPLDPEAELINTQQDVKTDNQ